VTTRKRNHASETAARYPSPYQPRAPQMAGLQAPGAIPRIISLIRAYGGVATRLQPE